MRAKLKELVYLVFIPWLMLAGFVTSLRSIVHNQGDITTWMIVVFSGLVLTHYFLAFLYGARRWLRLTRRGQVEQDR